MFNNDPAGHAKRVESIVDQVKAWHNNGRQGMLRTARSNWASMSTKLASNKGEATKIAVGELNQILDIDLEGETVTCEPGVTMGQLSHKLVPMGYTLVIHVEMESITIAGIAMGFGMETNSHREGLFQETVVSYELVNSMGEVVTVTEKSDPEIFRALPWSYGTLGFLTAITARIRKVKPFIQVQYIATSSREELCKKMTELSISDSAPDFLEATIYSKETAVIQVGTFVDEPDTVEGRAQINPINSFWKPFYYKWVETFIAKGGGEEIVPIYDYYHRFTRSVALPPTHTDCACSKLR
jgi:delta24-sterol reductase